MRSFGKIFIFLVCLSVPIFCRAMPPGTLLYRTSGDGKMFGYSRDPLIYSEKGIVKNTYSGHAAIYIGKEDGVDYVVEALSGGIVKNPAQYFVNRAENEVFLGAKIPSAASALQRAKAVAIAKSLVGRHFEYDFDFKKQKGPASGEWTCVGLTEKLYESADISNPNNLGALEYNPNYYAIDITPDGYDNYSVVNSEGDCFSRDKEFSKIARRKNILIPPPELIGYDVGLEYGGERYVFLPYTQFLQNTLEFVTADIEISSSFSGADIRGALNTKTLALRWSLINNPLSSLRQISDSLKDTVSKVAGATKKFAQGLGQKMFGSDNGTKITVEDKTPLKIATTTTKKVATTKKATTVKKSSVAAKTAAAKKVAAKIAVKKAVTPTVISSVDTKSAADIAKSSVKKNSPGLTPKSVAKIGDSVVKSAAVNTPSTYYQPIVYNTPSPISPNNTSSSDNWPKIALINKIYATGNNDWVELFNFGDHDFDLATAGYRLEKTKTAEDPSLIVRLGNTEDGSYPGGTVIKAHDSYLIVGSGVDKYYKDQADAIVTREGFTWPGAGYTLYLGVGAISASNDPDIVDAVGFGSEATFFQGSAPTDAISDNYVLNRIAQGENNHTDFNQIPADDPAAIAARAALAATSTDETATSTDETATSTDETATSTDDVASSTDETVISHDNFALINKIYATGDNDWIELFNPGDYDFDLASSSYRLEKTKTATDPSIIMRLGNVEDGSYPGGTIIKAHDSYLIVRDEASAYYKDQADAIAIRDEFGWTGSGYTIYLGQGAVSSSTDININDTIGFGSDASYFLGSGPALEINDGYFLNRISNSRNNALDFNLLKSDDPSLATSSEPIDINWDLFVSPTPFLSPGLRNVWHFEECYGAGDWAVGKWDCARIIKPDSGSFIDSLQPAISLNNFSLSFYYKQTLGFPRLALSLLDSEQTAAVSFIIEPNMITVEGLPNSEWRYYPIVPFNDIWHKANLVINQAEDYWAVYIDGQEVIRENFFATLKDVTNLRVSGDCAPALIDEIAIWDRSLTAGEILNEYLLDVPYSPLAARADQKPAELLHFWGFQEDMGDLAADSIGNSDLTVPTQSWVGRKHEDYALAVNSWQDINVTLDEPLDSNDLSLAFWWRNSSYPNSGRINIYLTKSGDARNLFALILDYFRRSYWYNGEYGILSEGVDTDILNDDAWHHVAFVYDSYRYLLRLYVDGTEKASRPLIWMRPEDRVDQLKISTDGYNSEIDDLALYVGALSPAEIQEIYELTK